MIGRRGRLERKRKKPFLVGSSLLVPSFQDLLPTEEPVDSASHRPPQWANFLIMPKKLSLAVPLPPSSRSARYEIYTLHMHTTLYISQDNEKRFAFYKNPDEETKAGESQGLCTHQHDAWEPPEPGLNLCSPLLTPEYLQFSNHLLPGDGNKTL